MSYSKRDIDIKNRLLDSVGEGEGEMIWENSIETLYYHMWNRLPVQVWCMRQGAGALGWRWGMGWGGKGVQDGEHMYTHGWFMPMYGKKTLQYCKVISPN